MTFKDMEYTTYDRKKAIESFGSIEILTEVSGIYLEETRLQYDKIFEAFQSQDFESVNKMAHLIKGGLVYLHAHLSADAAREIEELTSVTPVEDIPRVEAALKRLEIELEALLAELQREV